MTVLRAIRRLCAAVLLTGLVSGCATTGGGSAGDPLEPVNRAIFGFNETFDQVLLKPVAEGYRAVLPEMVRTGVTNFFSNIADVWIAANNLLQGKPENALQDVMRVAINTVIGLGGLIDVASDAGLEKHDEDFGQTLGRWGIGSGPYIVLPFLGPSTLRDGIALVGVDTAVDPVWNVNSVPTRNTLYSGRAVNNRANALDAVRIMEEAALDKYRFVRDAHLQRRRSLIYDGDPPREREPEASSSALPAPLSTALSTPGQAAAEASGNETVVPQSDMSVLIAYPVVAGATPDFLHSLR
jgi:phospholipid-binding lipoprotein MlaA